MFLLIRYKVNAGPILLIPALVISVLNSNEPNLKAVIYKITAVEQILVSIQNQVSTGSVLLIAIPIFLTYKGEQSVMTYEKTHH